MESVDRDDTRLVWHGDPCVAWYRRFIDIDTSGSNDKEFDVWFESESVPSYQGLFFSRDRRGRNKLPHTVNSDGSVSVRVPCRGFLARCLALRPKFWMFYLR